VTPAARPGRTRSEAARQAILEATRVELIERGYDKLSLDRIAAAAGVGKQTIYRWYPSKSALVAEGVLLGHLIPGAGIPDTGDLRADVTAWLVSLREISERSEGAALVRATIAATAEDETVALRYDEQVTAVTRGELTARLVRGIADGSVRGDAPIDAVVDSLVGVVLFRIMTRQPLTSAFIDGLVDLTFSGMGS
jgi:AcrR family transcriptional regulator